MRPSSAHTATKELAYLVAQHRISRGTLIRAITFDLWNTLLVEKSYTERRLSILSEALKAEGQNIPTDALESAYSTAQRKTQRALEQGAPPLPTR